MFSWIVLFFLWNLGWFSCTSLTPLFLINSDTFTSKHTTFFLFNFLFYSGLFSGWFFIVERWCKININISINDTYRIVRCFRIDLQNIDIELFIECRDRNSVTFMQAGKISQLIFKDSFWIAGFDEFCSVWTKFNHVLSSGAFFFHIRNECDWGWWALFWEFKHFEHPIRNVANSFINIKMYLLMLRTTKRRNRWVCYHFWYRNTLGPCFCCWLSDKVHSEHWKGAIFYHLFRYPLWRQKMLDILVIFCYHTIYSLENWICRVGRGMFCGPLPPNPPKMLFHMWFCIVLKKVWKLIIVWILSKYDQSIHYN